MSIRFFYNIRLVQRDRFSLYDDILSGLRKSYFDSFERIRDRITLDSQSDTLSYDYLIEQGKPMKWSVKDKRGYTLEETQLSEGQRYYILVYKDGGLFRRTLFSKMHTLLKVEYFDTIKGESVTSIEPRRSPSGLCILLKSQNLKEPLVLYAAPSIDRETAAIVDKDFTEFYVEASTNEGVVRFMTEKQRESFMKLVEKARKELEEQNKIAYLSEAEAPLSERIKAKDFNVKRNLSASLDITKAQEFISEYEEMDNEVIISRRDESVASDTDLAPETSETDTEEAFVSANVASDENHQSLEEESDLLASKIAQVLSETAADEVKDERQPDKVIESDEAPFYYYGHLDPSGNRSGFGRTVTSDGRTAYEGNYRDDKRSGNGAYYYKDGTLCYAGEWFENCRHGVGVGISSADGSIHVGRWSDNRPKGNGARLTKDGKIRFVCKENDNKETYLFNFDTDGAMVVSRYDAQGKKTAEKTVSLEDLLKS